jgi:hypothetical protein
MFWKTSKTSSGILFGYDDILLRLYIEVAQTGDFRRLIKSGDCNDDECLSAWEQIVKKQEKVTGSNQYNSVMQLMKGYASLLNDHTVIRAALIYSIQAPLNWEVLQVLKSKGYTIRTVDGKKTEETLEDLRNGLRRNENLITKATMNKKALERMFKEREEKGEKQKGFEEIIANLNFALGFNVDESITLARYNEYQRILKVRAQQAEEANKSKVKRNGR